VSAGKVISLVLGSIALLIALGLLAAGGVTLWANETQRDDEGFFSSREVYFSPARDLSALVSKDLDVTGLGPFDSGTFAEVRLRGRSLDPGKPLFIGIGSAQDVRAYLDGAAYAEVVNIEFDGEPRVTYRLIDGPEQLAPPAAQRFWVASTEGAGEQTLRWDVQEGRWLVVAIHADGSAGVALGMTLGARISWLIWLAVGLLAGGALMLALGGMLVYLGIRKGTPPSAPSGAEPAAAMPPAPAAVADRPAAPVRSASVYPVQLEGVPDDHLSRGLWLVKWILAIPHWFVLTFLWIGFAVMTVVAFFAILFTGRYPRGIFDFNVGVLRWSWRVGFYSYSALGTDRYPPFSLGPEPDYPARLDVPYPERLSRGLVLVKWWLLAIPHYIIISIFEGGWGITNAGWGWGLAKWRDSEWTYSFPGLIGVLVLISAIVLLFTGRYPREIFDFVVGMNRWVYRVLAYSTLMRDEYPPFRLDSGSKEQPSVPQTPPPAP
jgi:hypothetical protein